jgi:plasmid stability protein
MSHLVLSDLAPELVEELRRRADLHGHGVDDEVKAILADALGLAHDRALAAARRARARLTSGPANAELLATLRGR